MGLYACCPGVPVNTASPSRTSERVKSSDTAMPGRRPELMSAFSCSSPESPAPSCLTMLMASGRPVAHGFEVHAVWIGDERAVVVGVVVRADAGRPIVLRARIKRRAIEPVHLRTCPGHEREVHMTIRL